MRLVLNVFVSMLGVMCGEQEFLHSVVCADFSSMTETCVIDSYQEFIWVRFSYS